MDEKHDILGEALFALGIVAVRGRDQNLSLTAASTLGTLERTGPRRLTELAVSEGITQPSMTAVVSQLENLGLAERRADPGDLRVVLVAITRVGRHQLRTMRRAGASAFTTLINKLTEQEVAAVSSALPALRHLLELAGEPSGRGPRAGLPRSTR
jgi:DNA-binding MarR family transcriptional regulator